MRGKRNEAMRQSNSSKSGMDNMIMSPTNKLNQAIHLQGRGKLSFTKVVEDLQFELELYPRHIYFQRVENNGNRPNESVVEDGKIDWSKITDNEMPFFELSITKKATLDILLKHMTEVFGQPNPKKARLLIQD